MLLRDQIARLPQAAAGRVLAAVVPPVLAAVAVAFLTVAGFSALARQIGLPWAALGFAAIFAVLALAAWALEQACAARRRRRAMQAQARLAAELAAASAVLGSVGVIAPITAFLAAFLLARRR